MGGASSSGWLLLLPARARRAPALVPDRGAGAARPLRNRNAKGRGAERKIQAYVLKGWRLHMHVTVTCSLSHPSPRFKLSST
jgi:hypothetical protein